MAGIGQHQESPPLVESERDHRGVVDAIEVMPNRLVEVPHEMCLVQCGEICLHQLTKLDGHRLDCEPVPTDIGEGNARDNAARTDRDVMHVTTGVAGTKDPGMDPDS